MDLKLIACDGCGRSFATPDASRMLEAITGTCRCGGRFALHSTGDGASRTFAGGPRTPLSARGATPAPARAASRRR